MSSDTNPHIFVKVLDPSSFTSAGDIILVDENRAQPAEVADGGSRFPKISGNGRYVVFSTGAGNLVYTET
ncbi:MAG TPA: hypothetical protein VK400_03800, partial [Pyrinomonadaceae bacterium]|nr:hypothetical protein [Pyrinomonadaceae bacterium]